MICSELREIRFDGGGVVVGLKLCFFSGFVHIFGR